MRLRPFCAEDKNTVLTLRNDPVVRAQMYTQHEISTDEHARWFDDVLVNAAKRYFVLINEQDTIIGVIGFSKINPITGDAEWGFYSALRDVKGIGRLMGRLALEEAFAPTSTIQQVWGEALTTNEPSIKMHLALGFEKQNEVVRPTDHGEVSAIRFRVKRENFPLNHPPGNKHNPNVDR